MSQKLLTKKVTFQGKSITMYSLDGITWSTRADELQTILARHVNEQAGFGADLKGEEREKTPAPKAKPKKFNRVHDDGELDEIIEDDIKEDDAELDVDLPEAEDDIDLIEEVEEDAPPTNKKSGASKTSAAKLPKPVKSKAPVKNSAKGKPMADTKSRGKPSPDKSKKLSTEKKGKALPKSKPSAGKKKKR